MTRSALNTNPFYAARASRAAHPLKSAARMARLPQIPLNASPVPHLTSLYHFDSADEYGDRGYPGNCGGNLIRDLLLYFKPRNVWDPMTGSGTCRDVCHELGVECLTGDIRDGFDLCEPANFFGVNRKVPPESFDFVWIHPPYWRQKLYADDARDLSQTPTLESFLEKSRIAIFHCANVLKPGGKLAVLMGDYIDREEGFVPLTFHTKRLAFACGLRQHCTDIVRFGHGASSGRKIYSSAFIPGLHDTSMIFEKQVV